MMGRHAPLWKWAAGTPDTARNGTAGNGAAPPLHLLISVGVLLLSAMLQGCVKLGPDFETPKAPVADSWTQTHEAKVKPESADYSQWWRLFKDPVLDRLIRTAYDQNLPLRIAGVRILEARARLGITKGSQYPQVQQASGSFSNTKLSENAANFTIAGVSLDDSYNTLQFGFDLAWELDFWGRFRRGIEAADASFAASVAAYDDLLVSLTADVAATYVLIRTLDERLRVARENVEIQRRSFQIADVRFQNGEVSELDARQAETLLRSTQATIPALEAARRQAQNALSILLGKTPSDLREMLGGPGKIPVAPSEVVVGMPADLLRRRPDIRRAEFDAAAQSARIGVARADLFPQIFLAGTVGLNSSDSGGADLIDIFGGNSITGSVGPAFNWPILNYGRLKNNVRVQDARLQELIVAYQNTALRAAQEVEDGLVGFLRAQDQTTFLDQSVAAARRSVDLALVQYREGLVDYSRVLDTQQLLVQQEDLLTVSRGNITRNLIGVYKALGGGWEVRREMKVVPEPTVVEMQTRTDWGDLLPADNQDPPPPGDKSTLFRPVDW
ncbi:MAG: efflux transporter outer membrane subunit [Planctomycetota bacterium]|nr:efflux transporter outer membrane subunit [Planctomycetota bacterium]